MAITINFWNFSKRENSTKRPTTDPVAVSCVLKDDCSVFEPVIELALTERPNYNYCQIFDFGSRYYWIKTWRWELGRWVAYCYEDVLATWKTTIGNSTQYVTRSSNTYDPLIIDATYPAKTTPTYQSTEVTLDGWQIVPSLAGGTYVLGCVTGLRSATYGPVTYYAVPAATMVNFMSYMLNEIKPWDTIGKLTDDIAKAFIDPFQYIVSCMWFPFTITCETSGLMTFGYWNSTYSAGIMKASGEISKEWTVKLDRPLRTDHNDLRGEWEYQSPYATYWLTAYPWGNIEISGSDIDSNGITCHVLVDLINGQGTLQIRSNAPGQTGGNRAVITTVSTIIGVQIQLSQITSNLLDSESYVSAQNIGAQIAGSIFGNDFNVSDNIIGQTTSAKNSGSNGGILAVTLLASSLTFNAEYYMPADDNNQDRGKPLMQRKKISDIPGYIQVSDSDIELSGNSEENAKIKSYLMGGFFYE